MPTVGEQLKAERERQRLSRKRIAEVTHMRTDYVQAIEEGRYEVLGAPIYIRGFIRSYARALKMDEKPLLEQLAKEMGWETKPAGGAGSTAVSSSATGVEWRGPSVSIPWERAVPIFVGLGLGVAAFVAMRIWGPNQNPDPFAKVPEAIYQPIDGWEGLRLPAPETNSTNHLARP